MNHLQSILVFADGACTGNPGPGGWGAIVVFPNGHVEELGGGEGQTTNNQMELQAVIRSLERLRDQRGSIEILCDSLYVLRGITRWIWGWKKRNWKTAEGNEVQNQSLWRALSSEVAHRKNSGDPSIQWSYVKGHAGIPGNERVDAIAVSFAQKKRLTPPLYRGGLLNYFVPIHDLPEERTIPEQNSINSSKNSAPSTPYAYLSLVDGVPERHPDWKSCESRVKGRSGAKFKKVLNPEEERLVWESWGVSAPSVPPRNSTEPQ